MEMICFIRAYIDASARRRASLVPQRQVANKCGRETAAVAEWVNCWQFIILRDAARTPHGNGDLDERYIVDFA